MRDKGIKALILAVTFASGILVGALGGDVIGWRIKAFAKKALGELPELSWPELLSMTIPSDRYGLSFHFKEGRSLSAVINNPFDSEADLQQGERLFAANCAICHGDDASGAVGPSLRSPSYEHGDSEFSIYTIIRDGLPQTAMLPSTLEAVERWQLVGYLQSLKQGNATRFDPKPLDPVQVSDADLLSAGTRTDEWLTYSGNLRGWRYSALDELTAQNVSGLSQVWKREFSSEYRTQSSTPLVVDGRMFVSESPSNVVALDSRTGEVLWRFERDVPDRLAACCGPVNRGVAVSGDRVFVATLDAQLIALDANSGDVRWSIEVADPAADYTMTVAPLAFGDLVIVGTSGGEYATRGFIGAYDAATGAQRWRFNTIPGPGEPGHETWLNDAWRTGGGPAWVTGSYDAELDLLYWGVGNPTPEFQGDVRPGDNLYTNSVVALRGATGDLVWHFQFSPHDEHDWDSTQTPILTDLEVDGVVRQVICWANRNGHYYVLDRASGEFLTGVPFVRQNWNDGLDAAGRPIPAAANDVSAGGRITYPGLAGGTNWYPPAYDPERQLVFVHANDQGTIFTQTPVERLEQRPGEFFLGSGAATSGEPNFSVRALHASTGEIAWTHPEGVPTEARGITGLLATRGGLVFGATGGRLFALDSEHGGEMWGQFLGGNTQGPPITFSIDGRQVVAAWGGSTLFLFAL